MRVGWLFLVLVAVGLVLTLAPQPAAAQAEYPNVASIQPFSAQANFMSLPGYLRWITWRDQQTWLTYPEATRIVVAQGGEVGPQAKRLAEAGQ